MLGSFLNRPCSPHFFDFGARASDCERKVRSDVGAAFELTVEVLVPQVVGQFVARFFFVAVPMPLTLKEIVEVVCLAPQGQTSERLCQRIVEVSGSASGRAVL